MPTSVHRAAVGEVLLHWCIEGERFRITGIELPPAEPPAEVIDHPEAAAVLAALCAPGAPRDRRLCELARGARPTGFAGRVCEILANEVPAGRVISYGALAARAGSPGGARAVGNAMRRNPLPLLIPCHRVVAADGRLGGFQAQRAGSAARKRCLLEAEGVPFRADGRVAAAALLDL